MMIKKIFKSIVLFGLTLFSIQLIGKVIFQFNFYETVIINNIFPKGENPPEGGNPGGITDPGGGTTALPPKPNSPQPQECAFCKDFNSKARKRIKELELKRDATSDEYEEIEYQGWIDYFNLMLKNDDKSLVEDSLNIKMAFEESHKLLRK